MRPAIGSMNLVSVVAHFKSRRADVLARDGVTDAELHMLIIKIKSGIRNIFYLCPTPEDRHLWGTVVAILEEFDTAP